LGKLLRGELVWQLAETLYELIGASALHGCIIKLVIVIFPMEVIEPMKLCSVLNVEHQVTQCL
jgi:hypothetical protein